MAEFAQKRANSAITTLALGAKLCKAHTCNIFAQGKFDANSFFRPVFAKLEPNLILPVHRIDQALYYMF